MDIIGGFDQTNFAKHLLMGRNSKTMDAVIIFNLKCMNIFKILEDDLSLRK